MTSDTMRHEIVGSTLLIVHGPGAPDPKEWTSYCRSCATLDFHGVLVVVDRSSPGPSSRQRAEVTASLGKRPRLPNVAVVTSSAAHRGIVTVMSWLKGANLKAYSPLRLDDALTYAGVAASDRGALLRRVHELALGLDSAWIVETLGLDRTVEQTP